MDSTATSCPQATLYALANSWSTRLNEAFALLQAVEQILASGAAVAAALPTLRAAMDQISDCDDEGELLDSLHKLAQLPPLH